MGWEFGAAHGTPTSHIQVSDSSSGSSTSYSASYETEAADDGPNILRFPLAIREIWTRFWAPGFNLAQPRRLQPFMVGRGKVDGRALSFSVTLSFK